MGLFSKQLSLKELAPACRQLATAQDAGIPIVRSLTLAEREAASPKIRRVLSSMRERINQGGTLEEAARSQSDFLPEILISLLAAGEKGGKLQTMLRDLADYYEDRLAMRRSVIQMAAYPAFVLTAAWFLGTFALAMVGQLSSVMGHGGGYFDFEELLWNYALFHLKAFVIVGLFLLGVAFLNRRGVFQWISGFVMAYVWPLCRVGRQLVMARFCRSLSLLVGAGMNIVHAIDSSAAAAANPFIARDLRGAIPFVRQGRTLTEAFSGCRFMSATTREMLHVGEESGNLEAALHKASMYHLDSANHQVHVAMSVAKVLLILVVGVVVGYVVISFYAQLYGGMFNDLGI